jgi:hypothetical protein
MTQNFAALELAAEEAQAAYNAAMAAKFPDQRRFGELAAQHSERAADLRKIVSPGHPLVPGAAGAIVSPLASAANYSGRYSQADIDAAVAEAVADAVRPAGTVDVAPPAEPQQRRVIAENVLAELVIRRMCALDDPEAEAKLDVELAAVGLTRADLDAHATGYRKPMPGDRDEAPDAEKSLDAVVADVIAA